MAKNSKEWYQYVDLHFLVVVIALTGFAAFGAPWRSIRIEVLVGATLSGVMAVCTTVAWPLLAGARHCSGISEVLWYYAVNCAAGWILAFAIWSGRIALVCILS